MAIPKIMLSIGGHWVVLVMLVRQTGHSIVGEADRLRGLVGTDFAAVGVFMTLVKHEAQNKCPQGLVTVALTIMSIHMLQVTSSVMDSRDICENFLLSTSSGSGATAT